MTSWISKVTNSPGLTRSLVGSFRSTTKDGNKLCSICSRFDFQGVLAASSTYPLKWSERIPLSHIKRHPGCPFCRLVLKTLETISSGNGIEDLTDDGGRVWLECGRDESFVKDGEAAARGKEQRIYVPHIAIQDRNNYRYCIHSLEHDSPERHLADGCLMRGREVSQMIDIGLLKRWLRECDLFHGVRCKAEPEVWGATNRQGHFRLIDVEEQKIIPAFGRNLKYLALSYVWGGLDVSQLTLLESTSKRLFNKSGLALELSDIPTTIKDAMKITQMLGYRYLWVDALCIFQDSATDQAIQIKKMHIIYEHSELTIVCAAGADSWVGLPGVSSRTQTQHIEAIQGLRLANILPGFTQTIRESVWITRAWTLQEMYFSKRMLYFTDSQVYFKCECSMWREDKFLEAPSSITFSVPTDSWGHLDVYSFTKATKAPSEAIQGINKGYSHLLTQALYFGYNPNHRYFKHEQLMQYWKTIQRYILRRMTNPADILNAFQGVMTSYSEAMECDIFHGLPTNFLLHGLLFRSRHAAERRKGFPSWSWAGWQSAHNYCPPLPLSDMSQYIIYVDWQLKLASDINFYRIRQDDTSKIEFIPSLVNQAGHPTRLKHSPQRSIWYNIPNTLSPVERAQLLIFTTMSAIIPVELHQWDDSPENPSILLLSSSASGPVTSMATIPSPISGMDIVPETLEFIFMGDYKEYERDQKHVLIMAIKTDERGVSERINMASPLLASDWEAYPTSERTVYLI